jgi:hypothetical protein
MANFAECPQCSALHLDTPDARRLHAEDHANTTARLDALTRKNSQYLQEIAGLRGDITTFRKQLDAHPISFEPETISVATYDIDDVDIDEPDLSDLDNPQSTYANDDVAATIGDPTAGEPIEDAADAPTVDGLSGMYTPRNLMS